MPRITDSIPVQTPSGEVVMINYEKEMIVMFAYLVANRHQELADEVNKEINHLFNLKQRLLDFTTHDKKKLHEKLNLQHKLAKEELDRNNIYSMFPVAQRLFYVNRKIIENLDFIRNADNTTTEKERLIKAQLQELRKALLKNFRDLEIEMLSCQASRQELAKKQMEQAYKYRGLRLETGKKLEFTSESSEIFIVAAETSIHLYKHLELLLHEIPIAGALASIVGFSAILMTSNPKEMGIYQTSTTVTKCVANSLFTSKSALEAAREFAPSIAHSLNWLPFLAAAAYLINAAISVGEIIKAELNYNNEYKALNNLINQSQDSDWLTRQQSHDLSDENKAFKKAILENISIKQVCDNPNIILTLFTKEEFETHIKPRLLEHAKTERNKKIAKNSVTIGIALLIAGICIASFCLPGLGQAFALAIALTVVGAFFTKLILHKKLLKEKSGVKIDPVLINIDNLTSNAQLIAENIAGDNLDINNLHPQNNEPFFLDTNTNIENIGGDETGEARVNNHNDDESGDGEHSLFHP